MDRGIIIARIGAMRALAPAERAVRIAASANVIGYERFLARVGATARHDGTGGRA